MNSYPYRRGVLHAEDVALPEIAEEIGTPFYCYSRKMICESYRQLAASAPGAEICYSVKSNSNQAVIAQFAALGAGADVVSEGETRRALAAGVPPERIVFSGVGKTRDEIAFFITSRCGQINVESEGELAVVDEVARSLGTRVNVAFRVNPDVDAKTHDKVSTGRAGDKFGIGFAAIPEIYLLAGAMDGVVPVGLAVHIGSQLTQLQPFRDAFSRVHALVGALRTRGCLVERLDVGGGLGITYRSETPPSPAAYGELLCEVFSGLDIQLILEPGRYLTGNAGVLVSRVLYVKESGAKRFAVVDAAMNDLMRPALYGAWHGVDPVLEPVAGAESAIFDVVGPVCESGDVIAVERDLPGLRAGDLIAIRSAGAYGAVMSSNYNTRLTAPEVMVDGPNYHVIRQRGNYDTLIGMDSIPDCVTRPGNAAK